MLAGVVIFRSTHRKSRAISLFCSASLRSPSHIHLCPNFRIADLPSSVPSSKFCIPQALCLPLLRVLPGCIPILQDSELEASTMGTFPKPLFPSTYPFSFHILPHSFALFCTHKKLNSLLFNRLRTLYLKTPGGGGTRSFLRTLPTPQKGALVGSHRAGPPHFRQTLVLR